MKPWLVQEAREAEQSEGESTKRGELEILRAEKLKLGGRGVWESLCNTLADDLAGVNDVRRKVVIESRAEARNQFAVYRRDGPMIEAQLSYNNLEQVIAIQFALREKGSIVATDSTIHELRIRVTDSWDLALMPVKGLGVVLMVEELSQRLLLPLIRGNVQEVLRFNLDAAPQRISSIGLAS